MSPSVIIAYIAGLVVLLALGYLLLTPVKLLVKFIANGLLGGAMLWVLNVLGSAIPIFIAINPITALVAGLLGVPGVALMLLLQVILA